MTAEPEIAATRSGRLRGIREGKVIAFRGVPFAAPPVGELRFAPPMPPTTWSGVRDASTDGPEPPQSALRKGDPDALDEDCLTLSIWTPAADERRRPVLFWIFGGGFLIGSGSSPMYDGRDLAEQDIVVVNCNYRLGALGFLYAPGVAPGNLGALDQLAALRWVKENIAAFGGDPDNITVAGQSAGALSAGFLLSMPAAKGLASRLILQSPAFATKLMTPEEATDSGIAFLREAGLDPAAPDLRDKLLAMSVTDILAVQARVSNAMWRGDEGLIRRAFVPSALPPFEPEVGKSLAAITDVLVECEIPLLIGTARNDAAQFYMADPHTWTMEEELFLSRVASMLPGEPEAHLAAIRARRPEAGLVQCFLDLVTDYQLRLSALALADDVSSRGGKVFVYRFDYHSAEAPYGASHCVDIPFVFKTFESWMPMPFLRGIDIDEADGMADIVQNYWLNFIRSGDPNDAAAAHWPAFRPGARAAMHLDLSPSTQPAEPACYAPIETRN